MADMETWTWFQEQIALLKKAAKDNEVHRKGYTIKFKWRGGDGYGGAGRRTHDFGFFRPDGAPPLRSTSSVAAALGVDAAQLRGTKETESAPADKKGEKKRGAAAAAGTEGAAAAAAKRPKTSGDVKKDTSRSGAAGAKAKSAVTDKPPKASASHEAVVARLHAQATEAKAEAKQLNEKLVKVEATAERLAAQLAKETKRADTAVAEQTRLRGVVATQRRDLRDLAALRSLQSPFLVQFIKDNSRSERAFKAARMRLSQDIDAAVASDAGKVGRKYFDQAKPLYDLLCKILPTSENSLDDSSTSAFTGV
jgi:hypothetical protein